MKKEFLLVGLAALAALTISSCTKEQYIEDEVQKDKSGQVISLFATTAQVKTAIDNDDALAVNWVEGDKISVFIPSAGSDVYGDNYEFTADPENLKKGHFTGSTGTLSESNDWYLLYPYNENLEDPAGTKLTVASTTIIGEDAGSAQVQKGNDNTGHLASSKMPLYGKISGVAKGTTPKIQMHQAAAVVKIVVTNANTEPLTVQAVQFTANEEIAGMFAIDITDEAPSYTKCSTASHVSKTASLTVEDGTALAQGESSSFYLAIKPFVAEKGSTLKVSVNGYEKDLNMPEGNDVTFDAGKIKKITFNYNPTAPEEYELVTSLDDITDGLYVIANGGYLLPNTEVTSGNGPAALSIEGIATIEGTTLKTNSENIVWKFEGTNSAMAVRSYANDANYLYNIADNKGVRVSSSGSSATWAFAVNADGFSMTNNGRFCAKYNSGSDWRSYGSAAHGNYADGGQLKLYKRESTDPTIKADDIVGIPATGGEQHTTYVIKNIDTDDVAATCDGTVVTSATASAGNVTYTVAPNYTLKDVTTGTITLTSTSTGASKTISVSQDASVFEVVAPDEITLANTELAEGTFTIKSTFPGTISIDDETNFTVDNVYNASEEGQVRTVRTNGAGDPSEDRTATITITRQGLDDFTIPVRQYKSGNMPLTAPNDLIVAKHNENDGVKVTWTCSDNNVTSYVWIISTESTANAAEGDANAVKGTVEETHFTSEASNFSVNTTYHLYVKSTSDKTGFEDSEYVTETFTIDPKQDNAFDFSAQGYANQQEIGVVQLDDNIKATFDKGEGSNSPKYYNAGTAVRLYAKGTLTIGASAATKAVTNELLITKIVITFVSGDDGNTITANEGTYSESNGTGTWTGSASSVVFTVGDNKGNRRIKTISVDYTGGIPPVFVTGVSLNETSIELAEGKTATLVATVAPDNAKNKNVSWSSSDEDVATVEDGTVTAVAPGSAIITVTTEDGGKTATCDVTVTEASKYTITIADGITGGTVKSSHAQAAEGTEVTLTVTPDTDYELDELTVDDSKAIVTGNEYKFNMPDHNVAVTASFKAIPVLSTMDAIFAAATTAGSTATEARVKFDNWVISGVKNSNAYLTDNNGKGLIIYSSGHGFVVGDILSGTVDCKVQLYNEAAELSSLTSSTTGLTVTTGGTVTPATISIANLSGVNTGAVVSFSELSYDGTNFTDGTNTIQPYNTFMTLPTFSKTLKYNITGVYIQYNAKKEIAPRTNADIQEVEVKYITATPTKTSSISADGEIISVTVETNVTSGWTAESDNADFVIQNETATTFEVKVSENTDTENGREATITLKAAGAEDYAFKLTQSKKSSGEGPAVGTTMWSETWQGGDKDETPSAYGQEGTTVYNGGSVTYTQSSTSTKLYNDTMATTNLLLAKNNGTWTISGIPTGGKAKLTLEFETNNTTKTRYNLSSTTTGVSIGEVSTSESATPYKATAVISISGNVSTFDLTFKNTTTYNVRLDNLSIKVAE